MSKRVQYHAKTGGRSKRCLLESVHTAKRQLFLLICTHQWTGSEMGNKKIMKQKNKYESICTQRNTYLHIHIYHIHLQTLIHKTQTCSFTLTGKNTPSRLHITKCLFPIHQKQSSLFDAWNCTCIRQKKSHQFDTCKNQHMPLMFVTLFIDLIFQGNFQRHGGKSIMQ